MVFHVDDVSTNLHFTPVVLAFTALFNFVRYLRYRNNFKL